MGWARGPETWNNLPGRDTGTLSGRGHFELQQGQGNFASVTMAMTIIILPTTSMRELREISSAFLPLSSSSSSQCPISLSLLLLSFVPPKRILSATHQHSACRMTTVVLEIYRTEPQLTTAQFSWAMRTALCGERSFPPPLQSPDINHGVDGDWDWGCGAQSGPTEDGERGRDAAAARSKEHENTFFVARVSALALPC